MKRIAIASLLVTGLFGAQAQTFTDQARVRSAEPQYENINVPRQECRSRWINEPVSHVNVERQERSYGGAVLGGLAGGVLGNQVGRGSGRGAATVLGVVLGAVAGDHIDKRNQAGQAQARGYDDGRYENAQREVQRCRTVYDAQTRITGYQVTYEYRGQHYTTLMRSNPGHTLPVRVSVEPIEQY